MKYYIIGKMKSRQRGGGLIRLVCYVDIAIAIMKKVCKQFPKEEGRKFWPLHKTKDLSRKKIIVVVVILLSETSQNLFTCSLFCGKSPQNFHNSEAEKNMFLVIQGPIIYFFYAWKPFMCLLFFSIQTLVVKTFSKGMP